ncbi:hypothetical protein CLAFUW4_11418 [Fulvia fulva]|uniref:uncharacterized protein n=1 Tax=Passalora fulva TaxID=5499 RepID=UPI002852A75F|nr:uncharacterized protein CLAFUR5_20313 [Fulvia fulva]KAK4619448.1 hypothetical protein CLAFUR4_11424 [Fulvia fulva]KAK4620385.1 hypothetical protein CLAFUR0_11430 [Fulvia fulva]WMI38961.1 hypothetical protein CLAFUR5_20313 [Fulvia fulva]WPV17635.1 hypothetical protein CLAFUW4_11418 [Fulvia fulva]WPV32013.1 hypothetical protein CLAFUW7_11414 [Fulvia fulva]
MSLPQDLVTQIDNNNNINSTDNNAVHVIEHRHVLEFHYPCPGIVTHEQKSLAYIDEPSNMKLRPNPAETLSLVRVKGIDTNFFVVLMPSVQQDAGTDQTDLIEAIEQIASKPFHQVARIMDVKTGYVHNTLLLATGHGIAHNKGRYILDEEEWENLLSHADKACWVEVLQHLVNSEKRLCEVIRVSSESQRVIAAVSLCSLQLS